MPLVFADSQDRRHPLFGTHGEEVHDGLAFSGPTSLGDFKHFTLVDFSFVGKEEKVRVSARCDETGHDVFLFGIEVNDADTTAFLHAIFIGIGTFNIPASSEYKHTLVVRNEIFLTHHFDTTFDDFGTSIVTVFSGNFHEFRFNHAQHLGFTLENSLELSNQLLDFRQLFFNFLALKTSELLQTHVKNRLSLDSGEFKLLHQGRVRCWHVL